MTATKTTDRDFNVQVLTDTVRGRFAQKTAFMGSIFVSQGAVIVRDNMREGDPSFIGNEVTIPYFGTIGDFILNAEDNASTPSVLKLTNEKATVARSSLSFETTRWSRASGPDDADPYEEAADQILTSATRRMDALTVAEAATTPLVLDKYSSTVPQYLDWNYIVDGRAKWSDEQDGIVGMCIGSRTESDLRKLVDGQGRPLLIDNMNSSGLTTFCGVPLITSDSMPLTGSTMGAVTSAGTSPPVITLTGEPLGAWDLRFKAVLIGALNTWQFQFSTDGGNTWSATLTSAASVPLIDTASDSLVGKNGKTGVVAAIAAGTAALDNTWASTANIKQTTLILQKGALAFWYNRQALELLTHADILKDNTLAAMHMYHATKLYRRRNGGTKPGVVALKHNVRNYVG
jgi:hypothetical protein